MSYSVPVRQRISLAELKQHVYTLPDQPDLIPYRTSYYDGELGILHASPSVGEPQRRDL